MGSVAAIKAVAGCGRREACAEKVRPDPIKTQTACQACSRIAGCNKNATSLTGLGFPANTLKSSNAVRSVMHLSARVAKLVDAPGLGPDASNGVGVRVPSLAPTSPLLLMLLCSPGKNVLISVAPCSGRFHFQSSIFC